MTSSIVNYFIDNYLSQFLEINPQETQANLWAGTVQLNNIKFKESIFQMLNLPYLELVYGYIGRINAKLSLPRFYLYPIQIEVDNVFLHARQKNVNNISKKEQIEIFENNKKSQLKSDEELYIQMDKLKNESPGYVQQIINNMQLICDNIVIIFDDEVSYSNPFNVGITLKQLSYFATKEDFVDEGIEANIEESDIKYKRIRIKGFSIFLDYFNDVKELNYENKIVKSEMDKIDENVKNYLKNSLNFYAYCISELNVYGKDEKAHYYLLYNLILDIKLSMNDKFKENLKPNYSVDIELPKISLAIQMKQINALMAEKNYVDAKNYYLKGLEKEYYTKQLTEEEIAEYIEVYLNYYKTKYIDFYKNSEENKKLEENLNKLGEKVSYDIIKNIRELCKIKIKYLNSLSSIDEKIENEKNSWSFWSKENNIKKLQEEREKLLKEEEEKASKESFYNQIMNLQKSNSDLEKIEKDFLMYYLKFSIIEISLNIYEEIEKPLINFETNNLITEIKINTKSQYLSLILGDISISQYCSNNPKFKKIFFSGSEEEKNVLSIIFENNPQFEKTNLKLEIQNEKQLYIIANMYYINYIQTIFLKPFENIDISQIALNASDEVSKYIKEGYANFLLPGNHINIDLNINLKSPMIILPINFLVENNNDIIFFSFGDLLIKSDLPPRMDSNKDYVNLTDKSLMFDNYLVDINNMVMGTQNNYDFNNKPNGNEIVTKTNFSIKASTIIENKNINFDNIEVDIDLKDIKLQINEEQIVTLVIYLENMTRENRLISAFQKSFNEKNKTNKNELNKEKKEEEKKEEEKKEEEKKEEEKKEEEKKEEKKEEILSSTNINLRFGLFNIKVLKSLSQTEESITKKFNDRDFEIYKSFLEFSLKDFDTNVHMKKDGSMEAKIELGYIYLYDHDYEIIENGNKKVHLNPEFKCILGTSISQKLNENKFKVTDLLRMSINDKEKNTNHTIHISYISNIDNSSKMNISVEEVFISPNFSSLVRIYQFSMYYLNIYNESQNVLKGEELKEQLSDLNLVKTETTGLFKDIKEQKLSKKALTKQLNLEVLKNEIGKNINVKNEKIKSKSEINFEMKNVDIIFPIDPNNSFTQVIMSKIHINLMMVTNCQYENIYHNLQLYQINYDYNNSEISFSITKGRIDVYNFNDNYIEISKFEGHNFDNILNDYAINVKMKSSLDHQKQIQLTRIDILTNPFNFIMNFFHVSTFITLYYNIMECLNKFSVEYSSITTQIISRKNITEEGQISNELNNLNIQSKNIIKTNIDNYSICQEINGSLADMKFDICDYFSGQYKSLANLNIKNINLNYNSNNDPKDCKDFSLALFEMITHKKYNIDKYDPKNLYQYINLIIWIEMKYFNSNINQWECFFEPFDINFKLIQIIKRMRQRIEVKSSKIFNINLSCNVLRILKILKDKYEKMTKKIKEDENISIAKSLSGIQHSETVLKIINKTGISLNIFFDNQDNPEIIEIDNDKSFNLKELSYYKVNPKKDKSLNSTISFGLEKNNIINYFNFNHNQTKNYIINYNNQKLHISVSSYVNDELCKCILFSSTLKIHNYSQFDDLKILNSNNESILIKSDENISIPLNWYTLPNKEIYIEYKGEKYKLLKDINTLKEMPDKIEFNDKNSIAIDIQVLKNKYENKNIIELVNIIINPTILIHNQTPFEMKWNNYLKIEATMKKSLYCSIKKKQDLIHILKESKLQLLYRDLILNPTSIIKDEKSQRYSIIFSNGKKSFYSRIDFEENTPLKYYNSKLFEVSNFKLNSIHIVFYFDFIFVNRTDKKITIKNEARSIFEKDLEGIVSYIEPKKISSVVSSQLKEKIQIKIDESEFSEKFQLDTIGVDFVLKLKNSNKTYFPIGVLIKSSFIYTKTTLIIFENRYTFINKIGFDLIYKEEKDTNIKILKDNEENTIILKNENNALFRVGINNEFSQSFNIETPGRYDLAVKINSNQVSNEKIKNKLFTLNGKDYYYPIRCVIQTYNKGIIYIVFTEVEFPLSKIENRTNNPIQLSYNKKKIIIPANKEIPFIDSESLNIDKISINLDNNNYDLSFNVFGTQKIKTKKGSYLIESGPTNSNLTKNIIIQSGFGKTKTLKAKEKIIKTFSSITGYKFYLKLIGIGISLINQDPKEIIYISFYGLNFENKNITKTRINGNNETSNIYILHCKNFQIDYCLDNSFKVILSPIQQILPKTELKLLKENDNEPLISFLQFCILQDQKTYLNTPPNTSYPSIEFVIQPFDLKIDHVVLNQIISLSNELMESFGLIDSVSNITENSKEENLITEISTPINKLNEENKIVNSYAIQFLNIGGIKSKITFRLDKDSINLSKLPSILSRLITTFSTTITQITDTQLQFKEIILENSYTNFNQLYSIIYDHYKRECIFQLYKIIGGIDLIGNPIQLFDSIGTGFYSLFNEPRKALLKGPKNLGKGIGKGVSSLFSGIVGGTADSATKITGSLLNATKMIQGEKNDNNLNIKKEEEPKGLFGGAFSGLKKGFNEITKGVSGIVTKPIEGTKKEGIGGFFKGIGKGVMGVALAPVNTVLTVGNETTKGISNSKLISNKVDYCRTY